MSIPVPDVDNRFQRRQPQSFKNQSAAQSVRGGLKRHATCFSNRRKLLAAATCLAASVCAGAGAIDTASTAVGIAATVFALASGSTAGARGSSSGCQIGAQQGNRDRSRYHEHQKRRDNKILRKHKILRVTESYLQKENDSNERFISAIRTGSPACDCESREVTSKKPFERTHHPHCSRAQW